MNNHTLKRIAIVTNTSWNILNFRTSLVKSLQEKYEVVLIAPRDEYSQQIEQLAKTYFITNLSRKGTNPVVDLKLIKELKSLYKSLKIDLALHFTIKPNIYGSIAAKQAKIPSIAVVTGLGYTFLSSGLAAKAAKKLYKYAFKRNSLTIFQNQDDEKLFLDLGLIQKNRSKVVLGSGIDMQHFLPEQKQETTNFNFLFVGRLLYDKGIRELLEGFISAFKNNNNVVLNLVGEIDNENPSAYSETELNQIIKENNNINFHGRINDPREMITNADCVVLPSYREGLPRVMLEALSMATPVITTDVAGCRETVISGENGFLVEVQNSESIAEKMKEMYSLSINQRKVMGEKGRQLAESKFSTKVVNSQYHQIIERIVL